jgi:hypothetical protein
MTTSSESQNVEWRMVGQLKWESFERGYLLGICLERRSAATKTPTQGTCCRIRHSNRERHHPPPPDPNSCLGVTATQIYFVNCFRKGVVHPILRCFQRIFLVFYFLNAGRDSSYSDSLWVRRFRVQAPRYARNFLFSTSVRIIHEAHPAFCTMSTGALSWG